MVDQYNKNMLGVDKGDQLNSYSENSRKSLRLFSKAGLEFILGSVVSNSYTYTKNSMDSKGQ